MPTFTQDEIRTAAVGEEVGHGCIAVDKDTLKSKRTFLFHTQRIDLRTFKDSAGNIWRKTANTHITGWQLGWWGRLVGVQGRQLRIEDPERILSVLSADGSRPQDSGDGMKYCPTAIAKWYWTLNNDDRTWVNIGVTSVMTLGGLVGFLHLLVWLGICSWGG